VRAEAALDDLIIIPRRSWIALAVAAASIFLFVLDSGLLAVSLPLMERDFPGTSRATLSWAATGFLVALASLLLLSGRIADRRGRKLVYLSGVAAFTVGALATALAPSPVWLIVARVVQGAGGAFLTSSSLAIVLPLFPDKRQGVVVGYWGAIGSLAAILAPTLGALVAQEISWRINFAAIVPIGAATVLIGRKVLDEPVLTQRPVAVDPVSVAVGSLGLGGLAAALSQGRRWGWTSPATLIVVGGSLALIALFVRRSRREAEPLFDVSLFGFRNWTVNTLAAGLQQIGFFSWYLTTPLILVNLWGWSVLQAGSAMALGQLAAAVTGPLGGRWADRRGFVVPMATTALGCAAAALWLVTTAGLTPSFWRVFFPASMMMGAAGGVCGMLTTSAALRNLPGDRLGAANGAHQLLRRIAGLVGVTVALALIGDASGPEILDAARKVWLLIAVAHLAMSGLLVAADRQRVVS
jgi:NTE family protein